MKNFDKILLIMFFLICMISCKKDETNSNSVLNPEIISAKWDVTGTSDYQSFEFNESGNYIIVKNETAKLAASQIVVFGTYVINNNKTVVLSDFGTMNISDITENTIRFTISLDSNTDNEISIKAAKQDIISSSANTALLCRTWELVSYAGNDIIDIVVLFSDAGTYFVETPLGNGIGTWIWCNPGENKIAFTINKILNCEGIEVIKDIVITADSFTGIDLENGRPDEMIMKPVSPSKSAGFSFSKNEKYILGIIR
jgi:hypothetical protein